MKPQAENVATSGTPSDSGVPARNATVVIDQLVSSASNAMLPLAIAATSTISSFAVFALAHGAFAVSLGALRTAYSETILYSFGDEHSTVSVPRNYWLATLGSALTLVIIVLALRPSGLLSVLILGASIVWVLPQDHLRYRLLQSRPLDALRSDAVWLGVALPGVLVSISDAVFPASLSIDLGSFAAPLAVASWGLGGLVAFAVAHRACSAKQISDRAELGLRPRRDEHGRSQDRTISASGRRLLLTESLLITGGGQLVLYVVGFAAGLDAIALFAAGLLVFQPWASLVYGGRIILLQRLHGSAPGRTISVGLLFGVVGTALWGVGSYVALTVFGADLLLGDSWEVLAGAFLLVAIYEVLNISSAILADVLRVKQRFVEMVAARAFAMLLMMAGATIGGLVDGPNGAAFGRLIGIAATIPVWVLLVRRFKNNGAER
ncbi:MAG: hypothetical protein V3V01_00270 [Acidimicrobiales bacterium]